MKLIDLRCPACGGIIEKRISKRLVECEYCGSRFAIDDEEDASIVDDLTDASYDAASSSLSMSDYAAQACREFLDRHGDDNFRSAPKILRGLEIPNGENVFLIHDDTFMNSGKNGFAITERGLYCRDLCEEPTFMDWATFARLGEPRLDDSHITCDQREICYYTDDADTRPGLLELYTKLYWHAKRRA